MTKKKRSLLDKLAYKAQHWLGTSTSLVFHTLLFAGFGIFVILGFNLSTVLLILTTIVSLEAIYLSLFIQMAVNRHGERLKDVEGDVEDILEDTEDLTEDEKTAG